MSNNDNPRGLNRSQMLQRINWLSPEVGHGLKHATMEEIEPWLVDDGEFEAHYEMQYP